MTQYLIFRILGWFLITIIVLANIQIILMIEQPVDNTPLSAKKAITVTFLNGLVVWFIYTAMQI